MEWNWRFWGHCPGCCSESEPEHDNTKVSNYPGPILTYKQSVMSMVWLSWVTVVCMWFPCTVTTGASNYCHFLHSTFWQNGTRCRDGVKLLWCHFHLVWLVFESSIPTCACFHSETFCVLYEIHTSIIDSFWSYYWHSNRNILSPSLLTLSDNVGLC